MLKNSKFQTKIILFHNKLLIVKNELFQFHMKKISNYALFGVELHSVNIHRTPCIKHIN